MAAAAGPLRVDVAVKDLFDGKVLPRWREGDPEVLAYDLVFRQGDLDLLKIPFTKSTGKLTAILFDRGSAIPPHLFRHSSRPIVARYEEESEVIKIFIYKIRRDEKHRVGYERRIGPRSSQQDTPALLIHPLYPSQATTHTGFRVKALTPVGPLRPVGTVHLYKGDPSSPVWYTQAAFYRTCHVSSNNAVQAMDLRAILENYALTAEPTTDILTMLVEFANVVSDGFVYREDVEWVRPTTGGDYGDARLEISRFGDCEDFAHFYMRIFRLMMACYGLVFRPSDPMFTLWRTFADNYVPLVYICRVQLGRSVEYHSTMLMVPHRAAAAKPISFEVTNPQKSVVLDSPASVEEFYSWHPESYFLVDNYFIARIEGPVHELTVDKLVEEDRIWNY
jgi:hypothetical protein